MDQRTTNARQRRPMKVYMVHHHQPGDVGDFRNYHWENEINDIKSVNPDVILCHCMSEFDYATIYGNFFENIQEYLIQNNKKVKLLVPNFPNNVEVFPNIITESTYGFYINNLSFANTLKEQFDGSKVVADRLFTCYNNNAKYERALMIEELAKRHLLQHGIVTLQHPEQTNFDVDFKWTYHDGSKLVDEPDFILNSCKAYEASNIPNNFMRGFIDIVTESHTGVNEFFMTEKTTKSIGCLKPFLAVCSPNYHKFLVDEFGFELYDEIFDYSFDSVYDPNMRVKLIVDNIDCLVQQGYDNSKFTEIHNLLLPKMLRNRERFIEYSLNKDKMITESFRFLLDGTKYELFGATSGFNQPLYLYEKNSWI